MYITATLLTLLFSNIVVAKVIPLIWDAPVTGTPTMYTIYRSDNQAVFVKIGVVDYPSVQYTDIAAPNTGRYCYAVTATYTDTGESPYSNMVCLPPEAPINLRVQ